MTPRQLIRKVIASPTLADPGHVIRKVPIGVAGCAYVYPDGKRCIIGEMLHQLGVPDDVLTGERDDRKYRNGTDFLSRPDLVKYVPSETLIIWGFLQMWWDHKAEASRDKIEAKLEELFAEYYHPKE